MKIALSAGLTAKSAGGFTDLLADLAAARSAPALYFDGETYLNSIAIALRRSAYSERTISANTFGPGLLLEPESTNHIVRTGTNGVQLGVIGSGGALPTEWTQVINSASTSVEVTGFGTDAGLEYVELRTIIDNQSGATHYLSLYFAENQYLPAAVNGETWTSSFFVKHVAGGDFSNVDLVEHSVFGRNASYSIVDSHFKALSKTLPPALTRSTYTVTLSDPNVAYAANLLRLVIRDGDNADVIFRLYHPQLEKMPLATSPIVTTGGAASRSADPVVQVSDATILQSQGTVYCAYVPLVDGAGYGSGQNLLQSAGGTGDHMIAAEIYRTAGGVAVPRYLLINAGNEVATDASPGQITAAINHLAIAFDGTGTHYALNGTVQSQSTSGYDGDDLYWEIAPGGTPVLLLAFQSTNRVLQINELQALTGG